MKALNKKQVITYASIALVLGITSYIIYNRNKKKKQITLIQGIIDGDVAGANTGVPSTLAKSEYDKLPTGKFPIKIGQSSKLVFNLQKGLNAKYGSGIFQDGKMGDSTAKAMCKHIWKSCYTDAQARNYEVTNAEYTKVIS